MKQDKEDPPNYSAKTQNISSTNVQNNQALIAGQHSPAQSFSKQEKVDHAHWSGLRKFEPSQRNEKEGTTEPDIAAAVTDSRNQRFFNKRTKTANPSNNNSFENNIAKKKSTSKKTTQELIQEIKSGQYFSHKLNSVFCGNYTSAKPGQKADFVKILGSQKDPNQASDLATRIQMANSTVLGTQKHKRINSSGFYSPEQPPVPSPVLENNFLKNSSELIKKKTKKKDLEGAIKKVAKQPVNQDQISKA